MIGRILKLPKTRLGIIGAVVIFASAWPFLVNLDGSNVFLYLTVSETTLVVAASQGVMHLAVTTEDHNPDALGDAFSGMLEAAEVSYRDLIKAGPIHLFSEGRVEPLTPLRFSVSPGGDHYHYSAVEFPWLLIPIVLTVIYLIAMKMLKNTKSDEPSGRTEAEES